jgi:hypothetical protein
MAATTTSDHKFVVAEGLCNVLFNIGAHNRVSLTEMQAIFAELGNENGQISAQKMLQIL